MSTDTVVDAAALREEVKKKYREVAVDPHGNYHFHTGRPLAQRLGYDTENSKRENALLISALAVVSTALLPRAKSATQVTLSEST
jgi:hypothetical protein